VVPVTATPDGPESPSGPDIAGPAATGSGSDADLHKALRSIGRNTSIMFITTILFFLFNFASRVTAARALSVAEWGDFSIATSVTGLLSLVGLLGLNQATAQTIAYDRDPGGRRAIVRWSLGVTAAASISSTVAVFTAAGLLSHVYHNPALILPFQMLSFTIGFAMLSSTLASVFRGFADSLPNAVFNQLLNPGLFLGFVLAFLYLHLAFFGVLFAYALSAGVSFAGLCIYSLRRLPRLLPSNVPVPRRPTPHLWNLTFMLWGVMNLAYITTFADTIILGLFRPATVVGYYSIAITMARLLIIGTTAVTFAYMPVTARLSSTRSFSHIQATYQAGARWMLFLTLPFFLLFAFAPDLTIKALFGAKYLASVPSLQVLVFSSFAATLFGPVNASLVGLGQSRSQLTTSLFSALTNLTLSFSLIPTYGSAGAAVAWGVARALYPGLGLVILYRNYKIHPFSRNLLRPLALALVIGAPVVFVFNHIAVPHWVIVPLFLFCAALLFVTSLITHSVGHEDLLVVESFERYLGRGMPIIRRVLTRYMAQPEPTEAPTP
jgi:O-antigen/teichoic acid export membrane protein